MRLLATKKSLLFGWLFLGLVGCASASDGEGSSQDAESLGSSESSLEFNGILAGSLGQQFFDQEVLDRLAERQNTRYELRVTTCDVAGAASNDRVYVRVADGGYANELDAGTLGLERGKQRVFDLAGHLPVDASELDALTIRKVGSDEWCLSRVELWRMGERIWRHDSGDADALALEREEDATYRGLHPGHGPIWLDDQTADGPARSVVFSDVPLPLPPRLSTPLGPLPILLGARPLELEIRTCSDGADPKTRDRVQAILQRDGGQEVVWLDKAGSERGAGAVDRYVLNEHGFNRLDSIQIRKQGSDDWCIASVRVLLANKEAYFQSQRLVLNSDPAHPELLPATNVPVQFRLQGEEDADEWYFPGLPLQDGFWNYEHGAQGQPCRSLENVERLSRSSCDPGLACEDDVCLPAGGPEQPCNPSLYSLISGQFSAKCDATNLTCVTTAGAERHCVTDAGKRDKPCRDSSDSRGICDGSLQCDPVNRLCFMPGTEGHACRPDASCDGRLVCSADRKCIDPLEASERWFSAFQGCRPGSSDCNVCARNVKEQFDRASGGDQEFDTNDSGERMSWHDSKWNFHWYKEYEPSGRNPDQVFNKHVQGLVHTNVDGFKLAGTWSNRDRQEGGGIFIIGESYMANLHRARDSHPSGLSAFGKYLALSDTRNEVRLIDVTRHDESHLINWRASGIKRAGGGLGLAKLEGGSYLLVVSPTGSRDVGDRNVRFYHLTGDLEHPIVKAVGDWKYQQPSSWEGDYRYTENLSVISECGTGDVYVVNTSGKPAGRGNWLLSKVVNSNDGTGLGLKPLKAYFQDNSQARCSLRASATVWINAAGEIEPLCSERKGVNSYFERTQPMRYRYGTF